MTDNLNVGFSIMGEGGERPKPRRALLPLTHQRIYEHIKLQGLDEYTTNGLIDLAAKYPVHALPMFRKKFNLMIQRVRAQRKKEMNKNEQVEEERSEGPVQSGGGEVSAEGAGEQHTSDSGGEDS